MDKNIVADDNIGSSTYYENYSVSENGRIVEYTGEKTLFGADLITQKSVDFISANRDTPFFMIAGYYNAHSPYMWADPHHEQFRFNSALEAPQPYRPPNFLEEDMSDKPVYLQELSSIAAETVDISYKQILRSLLSVDDGVASLREVNILRLQIDQQLIHPSFDLFPQGGLAFGSRYLLAVFAGKDGDDRIPQVGLPLFILPFGLLLIALQVNGDLEIAGLSRVCQVHQEGFHFIDVTVCSCGCAWRGGLSFQEEEPGSSARSPQEKDADSENYE